MYKRQDEVYYEPCALKAGFHVSFARINPGSVEWRDRLAPLKDKMEQALAKLAGKPYKARKVGFRLPDFIDIVVNAGDDRDAIGATIGQSLPNWGPVATEGRGRTVDELIAAFKMAWADNRVAAVILTGTGEKAFCSGGDVKERAETGGYGETETGLFEIQMLHEVMRAIRLLCTIRRSLMIGMSRPISITSSSSRSISRNSSMAAATRPPACSVSVITTRASCVPSAMCCTINSFSCSASALTPMR